MYGWRKTWYALATDLAGDYYALDVGPDDEQRGKIFAVTEALDPYPVFLSFATMLQSILECYRTGAYLPRRKWPSRSDLYASDRIYKSINRGLSPHRLGSKEELMDQAAGARERFEREAALTLSKNCGI